MRTRESWLEDLSSIRVAESNGRRAPHKPLLLLWAIGRLLRGEERFGFERVREELLPLLQRYAPPVKARHQPELPYWHLQSDGLWVVPGGDAMARQKGGFPRIGDLKPSEAHFPRPLADALVASPHFRHRVVRTLLENHFPNSLHDDILDSVGLTAAEPSEHANLAAERGQSIRSRDPEFRRSLLRAYEHRCAATGFRMALGGALFGVEAAHVHWHSHGGPDVVANGLLLEPTMHKLLDAGAWTLSDDRRILVSADVTGDEAAVGRLRALHGKRLRDPQPGFAPVAPEFIRWHREPRRGGIFRRPAIG